MIGSNRDCPDTNDPQIKFIPAMKGPYQNRKLKTNLYSGPLLPYGGCRSNDRRFCFRFNDDGSLPDPFHLLIHTWNLTRDFQRRLHPWSICLEAWLHCLSDSSGPVFQIRSSFRCSPGRYSFHYLWWCWSLICLLFLCYSNYFLCYVVHTLYGEDSYRAGNDQRGG